MNSKSTKARRKAIPTFSLAELDRRDGVERFDHLTDRFEKWLLEEKRKRNAKKVSGEIVDDENRSRD